MKSVIHRWVRQANHDSSIWSRVANRAEPFENTMTVLQDPNTNRKLYLIGTTNSSTTLAFRTKKLIEEVNPSSVYVQTTPIWWKYAKHTSVKRQSDFTQVSKAFACERPKFENNIRGILWRLRFGTWYTAIKLMSRFPDDFKPFTPGLQIKFALESAEKVGASTLFGGHQIDQQGLLALQHEPKMSILGMLFRTKKLIRYQNVWTHNYNDFINTLHTRGAQAFAESMDRSRVNFLVAVFNHLAPLQKKILVDARDERIFRDLFNIKGDNIVAVVNQWHMQGIETHWRRATGTELKEPVLSPVHDMDIDAIQQNSVINNFLREFRSKNSKSEPGTHQNDLVNYHKQNFEYERTRHTHHDGHEDIPEPGQQPKKSHH